MCQGFSHFFSFFASFCVDQINPHAAALELSDSSWFDLAFHRFLDLRTNREETDTTCLRRIPLPLQIVQRGLSFEDAPHVD